MVALTPPSDVDAVARVVCACLLGTVSAEQIAAIEVPTLVVCGADDRDNGSPDALAARLPHSQLVMIPGDHIGAAGAAELSEAIVAFLTESAV